MTYVAKEDNDFYHPVAWTMTKNPTSAMVKRSFPEKWLPLKKITRFKAVEIYSFARMARFDTLIQ